MRDWQRRLKGDPRKLSDFDVDVFIKAAHHKPPPNVDQIRKIIQLKNPVRWRRLQRDFRWMQRQMIKLGLNPEDARWLP